MGLTERLDEYGKPAWIALMVAGFVIFWPVGLAILGYLIWSGRMGCGKHRGAGRWHNQDANGNRWRHRKWGRHETSGNYAFDEYREETLRRLEDEQKEFQDFLDQLRKAKDKAEFDQFMDDRKQRGDQPRGSDKPEGDGPSAQA